MRARSGLGLAEWAPVRAPRIQSLFLKLDGRPAAAAEPARPLVDPAPHARRGGHAGPHELPCAPGDGVELVVGPLAHAAEGEDAGKKGRLRFVNVGDYGDHPLVGGERADLLVRAPR